MPTVPTVTQRSTLVKRGPTAFASSDSPAGAFGATQGKALATLGNTIVGVSDDIFKASIAFQDEDDQREFKKLDIELAAFISKLGRGDGTEENQGFYATRGEKTLMAFPNAQAALQQKRLELVEKASNSRVRRMFGVSSQQRTDKELSSYLTLVGQQRRLANDAVGEARIDQATDDATAAFSDRAELERSIVIAKQEVATIFKDQPQEVIDNETEKAITNIIDKVVTAASRADNALARKIFEDFESQIDGVNRATIKQRLDARDVELLNKKIAAEARQVKELKKRQNIVFEKMIVGIVKEELDESQVELVFERGLIDAKQRANLLRIVREDDVTTDKNAKLALGIDIRLGNSSFDEIANAAGISAEDKLELVGTQDQVQKNGAILARADVKRLRKTLDDRIGGVRGAMSILDPAASERLSVALEEFDNRVLKGESPIEVRDDVLAGFKSEMSRDPLSEMGTLRFPKKWVGGRFGTKKDMRDKRNAAIVATMKDATLSQKEKNRELLVLKRHGDLIERMAD